MDNPDISSILKCLDLDMLNKAKHYKLDDKIIVRVGNDDTTPLNVTVVNDDSMICEKGVFNLIAGVPFTILANNIEEICDATFLQDNGARIFIQYKNLPPLSTKLCTKRSSRER